MFREWFVEDASASWRIGREDSREQRFRAGFGVGGCGAVGGLVLPARIVKAVARAGIELERDVAAERAAALDESPAALRRRLLIGRAMEGEHRRVGPVALRVKMSAQAAAGIEHERGAETRAYEARRVDRHGGERGAAAV